ncbi:hypothetical protein DIURU_004898 [Diutina rugosa]|uniref:Uncharacterized protein n=1 Tax=Diutina rugosa TaxID=5481 RepID=A0A642UFK1_DIURU|nr:uncharacterized protein DIURU_004898 [Diutina rugosa]KAA8898044.1 hypothetical protein DIURU_004898 [Diutina rugosa]
MASLVDSVILRLTPHDRRKLVAHRLNHGVDSYQKSELLRHLLCQRSPEPPIEESLMCDIDRVITTWNQSKLEVGLESIERQVLRIGSNEVRLGVWKGDITTLKVTGIVNAANSALLGCFQPSHKCIDNVIHSAAGPRVRQACFELMEVQDLEPVGCCKVTHAGDLPAEYILHTVGPQVADTKQPTRYQGLQLSSCYQSCLEALESVAGSDKSIAFCCISTGLFNFPPSQACKIAVATVLDYFGRQNSTITDVIFNVFTEEDSELYSEAYTRLSLKYSGILLPPTKGVTGNNLSIAKQWLSQAPVVLITAGAGLSAADGLDYKDEVLFSELYSSFSNEGLTRLYETIGHNWSSESLMWKFFRHHRAVVQSWPHSDTYGHLKCLAESRDDYFVVTSNADNLFRRNGFDPKRVWTPQGCYDNAQCLECGSVVAMDSLNDVDVPVCSSCQGSMTLNVRGGDWFNDSPYHEQELHYKEFLHHRDTNGGIILELGVGLNTPSVIRWPNEDLVRSGSWRLIRVGLGPSATAPFDLIEAGKVVTINADIKQVMSLLME